MATPNGIAADIVGHVAEHGCDETYYELLSRLKVEVGVDPNDTLPLLLAAGLPQALLDRADAESLAGKQDEARCLRERAARFGPEHACSPVDRQVALA